MFCENCGQVLENNMTYCPKCGSVIPQNQNNNQVNNYNNISNNTNTYSSYQNYNTIYTNNDNRVILCNSCGKVLDLNLENCINCGMYNPMFKCVRNNTTSSYTYSKG